MKKKNIKAGKRAPELIRGKPVRVQRLVRHRPSTWERLTKTKVYDPDGWRDDGKSFNAPITEKEWNRRMMLSTCLHTNGFLHGRSKMPNTGTERRLPGCAHWHKHGDKDGQCRNPKMRHGVTYKDKNTGEETHIEWWTTGCYHSCLNWTDASTPNDKVSDGV